MGSDETVGLSPAEASARLARYGENKNTSEKPPYIWEVASAQLRDPMNIMLVAVTVVSLVIAGRGGRHCPPTAGSSGLPLWKRRRQP
jgi:magnesium-transporting ATPase (P-type)